MYLISVALRFLLAKLKCHDEKSREISRFFVTKTEQLLSSDSNMIAPTLSASLKVPHYHPH